MNNKNKRSRRAKGRRSNNFMKGGPMKVVNFANSQCVETYIVTTAIYAWATTTSTANNYSTSPSALVVNFDIMNNSAVGGQNSNGLYGNVKFLKDALLYGFYAIQSCDIIFHPNKTIPTFINITSLPPMSINVALANTTYSTFQDYDTKGVMLVDFTETENCIKQRYKFPGIYAQTGSGYPIMGSKLWLSTYGIGSISQQNARDLQVFIGQDLSGTNVVTTGAASSQVGILDVSFKVKWCHSQNPVAL
jgi:hypothetical protein